LEKCQPLVGKADTLRADGFKGLETPFDTPIFKAGKFIILGPLTPAVTIAVIAITARKPLTVLADGNLDAAAVRVDADERFDCLGHVIISSVDNLV
jgi:hypothetical protein